MQSFAQLHLAALLSRTWPRATTAPSLLMRSERQQPADTLAWASPHGRAGNVALASRVPAPGNRRAIVLEQRGATWACCRLRIAKPFWQFWQHRAVFKNGAPVALRYRGAVAPDHHNPTCRGDDLRVKEPCLQSGNLTLAPVV